MARMKAENPEALVLALYRGILGREPRGAELADKSGAMRAGLSCTELVESFLQSREFREKSRVRSFAYPGHYYSPVVDPESVRSYVQERRGRPLTPESGIVIDYEAVLALLDELAPHMRSASFPDEKTPSNRYYYLNGRFSYADGITLRAMILHFRPRRIVEIGSGFSSACMLDTAQEAGFEDFSLTCIDPYADRLKEQLRPQDREVVRIIEEPVQQVSLGTFSELGSNDILFIDSTHILKTGSDVHFELFEILPALASGVLVHFHDVPYPFEYPDKWIYERNYSWNEAYALRAFLMYNSAFRTLYSNSLLAMRDRKRLAAACPLLLKNLGGSYWIRKN